MKLTTVGCTGSMSGPQAPASCYLLQAQEPGEDGRSRTYSIVMDLGPGSFGTLWKYLEPRDIDAVLLSHMHADHVGDLVSFHVYQRWNPQVKPPKLMLAGVGDVARRIGELAGDLEDNYEAEFDFVSIQEGCPLRVGPFTITPFSALHTVEAYSFRVQGPGEDGHPAVLTYTGDTDLCEGVRQAAQGADLLLCEAGFADDDPREIRGVHLNGQRAGQLAGEAGVGRLVLTHITPWTDPTRSLECARAEYPGPVELAHPGATYLL